MSEIIGQIESGFFGTVDFLGLFLRISDSVATEMVGMIEKFLCDYSGNLVGIWLFFTILIGSACLLADNLFPSSKIHQD